MANVFDYSSYKDFVRDWVHRLPKRGYGQYKRIAAHLGVGTVLVSQVFNGDRDLSEEQALELSLYLGLLETERRYFVGLVRFARAGTKKLRDYVAQELAALGEEAKELKGRVKTEARLSEADQAVFYSDWVYSAIRLAVDVPEFRELSRLAERLQIPPEKLKAAAEFLVRTGLCESSGGELRMGPKIVFLSGDSPYILPRQKSWRLRGIQKMDASDPASFFFTCPLVCSKDTAQALRKKLIKVAEEVLVEVKDSPSEELLCLNLDWFKP